MTNYATETEAESYESADLARIALQAAIEAVEKWQDRHGPCDAPLRVTLHVDNGNEADREGTFDLPEIDEPNEALRRAAEAHDRYTGRHPYQLKKHNGNANGPSDVNPYDHVRVQYIDSHPIHLDEGRADTINWDIVSWYRVLGDEE